MFLPLPDSQLENQEEFMRTRQEISQMESQISQLESRLSEIENDRYGWRDPTDSEVESMRKAWEAANPFKISFEMPDFTQQKIRFLRTDAAAAEQQATAKALQDRIANLEAKLGAMKAKTVKVTPIPKESLQEREAAHAYAVQAEIDRQKRNALKSVSATAQAPTIGNPPVASSLGSALKPPSNQTQGENGSPRASPVTRIISAYYGADNTFRDVTTFVQNASLNGNLRVDNGTLGGDPIFGKVKTLRIRYGLGSNIYEKEFTEGSAVKFNAAFDALDQTGNKVDETRPNAVATGAKPSSAPDVAADQSSVAIVPNVSEAPKIISAFYGAEDTFRDVTPYVQNAVRKGNGSLRADSSTLGGDPIFGKVKTLKVRYQFEGRIYEREFTENSAVRIP